VGLLLGRGGCRMRTRRSGAIVTICGVDDPDYELRESRLCPQFFMAEWILALWAGSSTQQLEDAGSMTQLTG
jgi:hypothetical protein